MTANTDSLPAIAPAHPDPAPHPLPESCKPCPPWCERPAGHAWEDGTGPGDLIRVHQRTLAIPGTDHGTLMMLRTEYRGSAEVTYGPITYAIDTGVAGDNEVDADGARGLTRALGQALLLGDEPRGDPGPPGP
jgi:hypothetical protein